jgi:DNA repair photolyase
VSFTAPYGETVPHRLLHPAQPGELTPPHEEQDPPPEASRPLSLNPYAGCELACVHCQSRERPPDEPAVCSKRGAGAVLSGELRRAAREGLLARTIVLGASADPWQPLEARERTTRGALEALLRSAAGIDRAQAPRLLVATRSALILRDLELLRDLDRVLHLRVAISVCTLDPDLSARLEPGAPAPARRLTTLAALTRAGLCAGVICQPVLPELTESPRDLRRIVCAAREGGAAWLAARVLSLRGPARRTFFAWLRRERPHLVRTYTALFRGGPHPPETVHERVRRVIGALRAQYGLPAWVPFPPAPHAQRDLFPPPPPLPAADPLPPAGLRRLPTARVEPAA